ncbi:MAG: sodium/proline symporter PutP [Ruminococcaceae bacterium]|nr:sodium/proline symporter PutP [Oscillospiraceae bacterium]
MNLSSTALILLGTIGVYLLMMIIIGAVYSRKTSSVSDFYLGGRKLGPLVTAMSAEASDMSSWLLMGLPGVAYLSGIADAAWTAIGLAIGTYINWLVVSKRLRRYSARIDAITVPDFFSKRFGDKSGVIQSIAALVIIVFFVPYTASGFAACGKLFSSLFGMDYVTAMIISAVVIVAYTALGGFLAASTTDFIQSIVMSIALIAILGFGVYSAGGFDAVWANANSMEGYMSLTSMFDAGTKSSTSYGPLTIASTMAWGLGYFGMPHILLRFMAIKDDSKLKLSRRVGSIWVVIAMFAAIVIGVVGNGMTAAGSLENLADSETIIVKIAGLLSENGALFAIIAGVVLAGILAATMSTADSQLLAASSSMSENILGGLFRVKMSRRVSMIVARLTVIGVAIIGVILALDPNSNVFQIVSFAWAGFGAAFGPLMLLALFWKRTNRWGALAGMIAGGATVFIWKFVVRPMGGILNIYELLPAFIVSLIVIVIVSLITGKPKADVVADYETYKADMKLDSEEFNAQIAAAAASAEAAVATAAVCECAETAAETAAVCECAECAETAAEETVAVCQCTECAETVAAEETVAEEVDEEYDAIAAEEAALEAACANSCAFAAAEAEETAEAAAEVVEETAEAVAEEATEAAAETVEVIEETVIEVADTQAE